MIDASSTQDVVIVSSHFSIYTQFIFLISSSCEDMAAAGLVFLSKKPNTMWSVESRSM